MEKLLLELTKFIEETRKNNQERPFLTDFENGWNEGSIDVVDALESLIKKCNI